MSESTPRLERYRHFLTALLIVATVGGAAVFVLQRPAPTAITIIPPAPTATPAPTPTREPLQIYVTGAVASPQTMVTVPYGSRVIDAIEAAGGFAENADRDRVNQAEVLHDGDQVHVYAIDDANLALATPNDSDIVYINNASAEEIERLPRIGPALAARIIEYRDTHGPFTSLDDLDNVSGIGPSTLEEIGPFISFEVR